MLKKVRFENFRGFRRFDAEVAPVTAFLGPNSSGKTSALHAIRLACEAVRMGLESDSPAKNEEWRGALWTTVTNDTLISDHFRLLPVSDWRAMFVDQLVPENQTFTIDLEFEESDKIRAVHVEVICARNEQLKLTVRVLAPEAIALTVSLNRRSPEINKRSTAFVEEHAPLAVFVPPFYGTVRGEEYRSRVVVDRSLGSGDQSHVVRNLVADLEPDQFAKLNAFLEDTVGARLTYRTHGDAVQRESPMVVRFRDSDGDIEISAAGAGLINLIALFATLSRSRHQSTRRRVIFLLDEPEAHLHPRLQADSTERLSRLITAEFGAQLLIATHSVDILNRLSTRGARLLRCDRVSDPSTVALDGDAALFDDVATWADLTPYTAINFLASRRVAFCEGDDELAILPRLAELRFRNDPSRLQRFRRWALVRLHGASNRPVAELLARLVRNDAVRAQAKDGLFEVLVVLDRDHERAPGNRVAEHAGVKETEWVWSRHSVESLMVDVGVLTVWIRAFLGDKAPADSSERLQTAIDAANEDQTLIVNASDQLAKNLAMSGPRDAPSEPGERFVRANRDARALVRANPETWQRGKDRARFVLSQFRDSLPHSDRRQFPTDVMRLLAIADLNRIGDPSHAAPAEVADLLDRMTAP